MVIDPQRTANASTPPSLHCTSSFLLHTAALPQRSHPLGEKPTTPSSEVTEKPMDAGLDYPAHHARGRMMQIDVSSY